MDYNILINRLTSGEATYLTDDSGLIVDTKYSAPTKTMLLAAKLITKMVEQLTANQHYMKRLENERNAAYEEIKRITVRSDRNVTQTEQNRADA